MFTCLYNCNSKQLLQWCFLLLQCNKKQLFQGSSITKCQINIVKKLYKLGGREILIKNVAPYLNNITILICTFYHSKNLIFICRCLFLIQNCNAHFFPISKIYMTLCFLYCQTKSSLIGSWLFETQAQSVYWMSQSIEKREIALVLHIRE